MTNKRSWNIDVKSLTPDEIVRLLSQLNESKFKEIALDLRRELTERARDEGANDETIVRTLTRGVPRGTKLDAVAKEWAGVLGLSVTEFKRIANVR